MDEVHTRLKRKIAPDRAWHSLFGTSGAVDGAADVDGVGAFHGEGHQRRRGDEVDESREEWPLGVGLVMLLGESALSAHQLQSRDAQATLLVAIDDAPDELALDAVGLDQDEGSLAHGDSSDGDPGGRV